VHAADGRGRALIVGGGIANFTDVAATFKGIIQVRCGAVWPHGLACSLALLPASVFDRVRLCQTTLPCCRLLLSAGIPGEG
jgi:hypothetical protein